jgi:hypothetical protein
LQIRPAVVRPVPSVEVEVCGVVLMH